MSDRHYQIYHVHTDSLTPFSCSRAKMESELLSSSDVNYCFCGLFNILVHAQECHNACGAGKKLWTYLFPKTSSLQSPSKSSAPPVYSPFAPPDFSSARLYLALAIDLSHSRKPFPLHTNNLHGSHGLCSRLDTTLRPQEAGGAAGRSPPPLQECPPPSAPSKLGDLLS